MESRREESQEARYNIKVFHHVDFSTQIIWPITEEDVPMRQPQCTKRTDNEADVSPSSESEDGSYKRHRQWVNLQAEQETQK